MTTATGAASPRVAVGTLMAALLSACVAFQLNASMLSPALASCAGLSFAVLYAVSAAFAPAEPTSAAGYVAGMLAGVVILAAALAASFLIPRPSDDEATAARRQAGSHG
jgi:hypothetical protein